MPLNTVDDDFIIMSRDIMKGRSSRKILTITAALFAVALMLAAPLFIAVDTDADSDEATIGFRNCMDARSLGTGYS